MGSSYSSALPSTVIGSPLRKSADFDESRVKSSEKESNSPNASSGPDMSESNALRYTGNADPSLKQVATWIDQSGQSKECYLLLLPSELVDLILSFLHPPGLAQISATCSFLSTRAKADVLWLPHVQANTPGTIVTAPYPCSSFYELYIAHEPHWFVSRHKLWFSDYYLTGKLVIARYDPRRGCIEGYRMVAEKVLRTIDAWETDDEVMIHSFEPRVHLHMDKPVLQLDAIPLEEGGASPKFQAERAMRPPEDGGRGIHSTFLLTRSVEERPNMQLWPPPIIPAKQRVRNASQEGFFGSGHKPQKRAEVCESAFRLRRWTTMHGGMNAMGIHLDEDVYTYSTLEPALYTPTEDKPFRGIWVGDYSGHGCEFLLVNQPDDIEPFDESSVIQAEDETHEQWERRKQDERIYRGSLEAIKLTGDPNVPRGEYTFIADDIGRNGFVRTVTEQTFHGARIVRSRGHIAARMFRNDKYIESQLIIISPNRLAQYWVGFGHISFYERVDIDRYLDPLKDKITL